MSIISKKIISGKERKQLIGKLSEKIDEINEILPKKEQIARYNYTKSIAIIANNSGPLLLEYNERIFPHIKLVKSIKHSYPVVKVDTGAIRFVTNGADVMRPGITHIDGLVLEGDLVLITEETKGAPLGFGIAMYDAVDMQAMTEGKCIKTIHYLKDKYWDLEE